MTEVVLNQPEISLASSDHATEGADRPSEEIIALWAVSSILATGIWCYLIVMFVWALIFG